MNSKPHRTNSKFQLRYFLAGDCKTADGAWSLMYSQKNDMETKLRHSKAQLLERQAKLAAAHETKNSIWFFFKRFFRPSCVAFADAEIALIEADIPAWELNVQAAEMELKDIEDLMAELEPMRKYSDLPLLEATEAAQRDEWCEELKSRAELSLYTTGGIQADTLGTIMMHPDFATKIVPHIGYVQMKMANHQLALQNAQNAQLEGRFVEPVESVLLSTTPALFHRIDSEAAQLRLEQS